MADIATDLKQRFNWAEDLCLEAYEVLADGRSFERSDADELAIEIFKRLLDTVDAIPPSSIASAEQLRSGSTGIIRETVKPEDWRGRIFFAGKCHSISRRGS